MSFLKQRDLLLILLFIILFIAIRSLHFASSFNFSSDQAAFSIKAYQIFKNQELTLIGPPTSINFEGRQIYQGPAIYYFLLVFLVAGGFDPILSSYLFMIFCSIMIVPLFIGVKLLVDKNAAWFMVILYTLLPYFVDYTKFFWNPNFQLSLTPLLIFLMGYCKKKSTHFLIFLTGGLLGLLLQFHYQFVLILIAVIVYYAFTLQKKLNLVFLFSGILVGFSPILLFEVRNNFYNFNTLILYLGNFGSVSSSQQDFQNYTHYLLTVIFFLLLLAAFFVRNFLNQKVLFALFFLLLTVSILRYLPQPNSGFRMAENWNYLAEEKAFNIIKTNDLKNINVTNLIYDTKANVQKYLIIRSDSDFDTENYNGNDYLYVIATNDKDISEDQAFEVTQFKPFEITSRWAINDYYSLFLLKRNPKL